MKEISFWPMETCTSRLIPPVAAAVALTTGYVCYKVYRRRARVGVKGKSVLITGCDRGFGHVLALGLQSQGLAVYAGCLDASGPGAADLRGDGVTVLQMDVTSQEQMERAVSVIEGNTDHDLHAVVNNAGMVMFGEVEFLTVAAYQKLLDVNFLGAVRVTKQCLPLLRKHRGSRVVNVTSLMGKTALYNLSAYCASKFALDAFSSVLRQEMAKWGVHVAVIQPGPYETGIGVGDLDVYINKLWTDSTPQVQSDYGREYYDAYRSSGFPGSPRIHEVTDALEHAVLGKYPQKYYRRGPGRFVLPWISWLCPGLFDRTPRCIMSRFTFYTGAVPRILQ